MADEKKGGQKVFSIYFNAESFILEKLLCFILNENLIEVTRLVYKSDSTKNKTKKTQTEHLLILALSLLICIYVKQSLKVFMAMHLLLSLQIMTFPW